MAINLSYVTFTDQDDIIPLSGVEDIGIYLGTVNTLAGDDIINGGNNVIIDTVTGALLTDAGNFSNAASTINTNSGNDLITGTYNRIDLYHSYPRGAITNSSPPDEGYATINTGDGNDIITATGDSGWGILLLSGTIDTGEGNDIINGTGGVSGLVFRTADFSDVRSGVDTGEVSTKVLGLA